MINRILIRIKVVQILYSYLLSRSDFRIDTPPEASSRDRRFAYSVYLDMLMLIQELSGCRVNNPGRLTPEIGIDKPLRDNRVGRALADNVQLKDITFRDYADMAALTPVMPAIKQAVESSAIYKEYARKRKLTLDNDVDLWCTLLETTVLKCPELNSALRANPDFSLAGLNHGIMDAVVTLRSYNESRTSYMKAKNELQRSLDDAYRLYLALFALIVELTDEQADRLEAAKGKYLASANDLNPDTRLVDNELANYLRRQPELVKFIEDNKFSWLEASGLRKALLDSILASDLYAEYTAAPTTDWYRDCDFWRSALKNIIIPSDSLEEAMEGMSIFWNDDLPIVGTFVLKTIRRLSTEKPAEDGNAFLPAFKDEEDAEFGGRLFEFAVTNRELYRSYIDRFISTDWDPERLAFMDIVIMIVAIAEILNFPGIPVPVSLNEYIEIANTYSTPRSGPFINGILYSVIKMLADDGLLSKPFGIPSEKLND